MGATYAIKKAEVYYMKESLMVRIFSSQCIPLFISYSFVHNYFVSFLQMCVCVCVSNFVLYLALIRGLGSRLWITCHLLRQLYSYFVKPNCLKTCVFPVFVILFFVFASDWLRILWGQLNKYRTGEEVLVIYQQQLSNLLVLIQSQDHLYICKKDTRS